MKPEIANIIIVSRAKHRGVEQYTVQHRELRLNPNETRGIDAENESWLILGTQGNVTVESNEGFYRVNGSMNTEDVHLHEGVIEVSNQDDNVSFIEFLQVSWG
ncbi:MAG: hypothetical protein U0Y10_17685 [Spirosomataceae bacterium]